MFHTKVVVIRQKKTATFLARSSTIDAGDKKQPIKKMLQSLRWTSKEKREPDFRGGLHGGKRR